MKVVEKEKILRFSPLVLVILVFLLFSIWIPRLWLSWYNFSGMLEQAIGLSLTALGLTVSMIAGEFDMSVGSIVSVGSMVCMMVIAKDHAIVTAFLSVLMFGFACGLINGLIRTVGKIPGVIPTIGTQSIFAGIALLLNNGNMVYGSGKNFDSFTNIGRGSIVGFPISGFILIIVTIMVWISISKMKLGRLFIMIGGNTKSCELSGLKTNTYIRYAFILSGLLAAIGGFMASARSGSGNPREGVDLFLNALIAVNMGGAFIAEEEGEYSVLGTIIGSLFITMTINGLQLTGQGYHMQCIIRGVLLILARVLFALKFSLITKIK